MATRDTASIFFTSKLKSFNKLLDKKAGKAKP